MLILSVIGKRLCLVRRLYLSLWRVWSNNSPVAFGIDWRNYCNATLVNGYPTNLEKLPPLIERIKSEQRNSKNYVLFLGSTDAESNQAPCLSLVRFQIELGELVLTDYQRY